MNRSEWWYERMSVSNRSYSPREPGLKVRIYDLVKEHGAITVNEIFEHQFDYDWVMPSEAILRRTLNVMVKHGLLLRRRNKRQEWVYIPVQEPK